MRLKAKVDLAYAGRDFQPGMLFDALEQDGRQMISRDEAEPFNLEDPSTRPPVNDLVREESLPPGAPAPPEGHKFVSGIPKTGDPSLSPAKTSHTDASHEPEHSPHTGGVRAIAEKIRDRIHGQ